MRCRRALSILISAALALSSAAAIAQPAPPKDKPPPGTGTDMEIDPDAKPKPEATPPPLPPAKPDDWGVGGKDDEGKFAPQSPKKEVVDEVAAAAPLLPVPPGAGDVDFVIGFGRIHNVVDDLATTKLTTLSFVFGFHYKIADVFTVGARFPITNGTTQGPLGDKDKYATNAIGAFVIDTVLSIELTRTLHLPVSLSLFLPTAAGDPFADPTDNVGRAQWIINQSAAASRGWEEQSLFMSKRFGFVPGVGLTYDKKAIHVGGATRLEIIAKTGGNAPAADPVSGTPDLHTPSTNWVTELFGGYEFLDAKLMPGLKAWLAVTKLPVSEGTKNYSGPQFVVEPNVSTRIGINSDKTIQIRGQIGYILPLGGELGGKDDASVSGFRIRGSFLF
jgi:hypothetical protein